MAEAANAAGANGTSSTAPISVLVVDDDEDIRIACAEVLQMAGCIVATAGDGQAALDALRAGFPAQIVFLDLSMPGMNGFEFREEQRRDEALASIPVVVVSAGDLRDGRVAAMAVQGILPKPFAFDDLIDAMRRWAA